MNNATPIHILIADDHPVVHTGIAKGDMTIIPVLIAKIGYDWISDFILDIEGTVCYSFRYSIPIV